MEITFVSSGGGKLAVEVEGEGPLVICSPGMGDFRDAFAPLASHLSSRGYRVALVDLRGHGDSTLGFDHYGDDEAVANDLLAVIDALGAEPALLAGASISAAAAVIAAGKQPAKVKGLILLGPYVRNGAGTMMRGLLHVAFSRPWGPFVWRMFATKLWPGLGDKAALRASRSKVSLTRPGRWGPFHTTTNVNHDAVAPWIKHVRAPVLVVMGDADPDWTDPMTEAAWVASNFADAETVAVHGAGHAPMLERSDVVNHAVTVFLNRIKIAGSPELGRA